MTRRTIITAIATGLAMVAAAPAFAQTASPSQTGYTTPPGQVQNVLGGQQGGGNQGGPNQGGVAGAQEGAGGDEDGQAVAGQEETAGGQVRVAAQQSAQQGGSGGGGSGGGGSLPFTGLDLALIAGAGAMLLLLGFGMRRLSRSATPA